MAQSIECPSIRTSLHVYLRYTRDNYVHVPDLDTASSEDDEDILATVRFALGFQEPRERTIALLDMLFDFERQDEFWTKELVDYGYGPEIIQDLRCSFRHREEAPEAYVERIIRDGSTAAKRVRLALIRQNLSGTYTMNPDDERRLWIPRLEQSVALLVADLAHTSGGGPDGT